MGEQIGALEVALDAITVGVRHRKDVGDLEPLMASIAKRGLLQPITLTPELVLVCGWRRLEAMRRLGWTHTRPWWRPGLSDGATTVLAEHDENFLQQAYTKSEQATLFRELKTVLQQEAARRQSAHWFTSNNGDGPESQGTKTRGRSEGLDESDEYGSGSEPEPEELGTSGDAREQAAQLVAGRKSYHALERIGTLMDLAVDPEQPKDVRALAADAVARIDEGHPLKPEWARVQAALAAHAPAADGLPGGRSQAASDRSRSAPARSSSAAPKVSRAGLRAWVMTWRGAAVLLDEHDPAVLGPALPETDWNTVRDLSQNLASFLREAQAAREEAGLPTTPPDTDGQPERRTTYQPDGKAEPESASGLASVIPIGVRS